MRHLREPLLGVTFGSISREETSYATDLVPGIGAPMIVLGDRNFAAADLLAQIADRGADLLVRVKNGRRLPVCRRCDDGSWISRMGALEVRVVRAEIHLDTDTGHRSEVYQLVTTVNDTECSAADLVELYHQRWDIETAFCQLKQTILGGRVLRARTRPGWSRRSTPCW